MKSMRRSQIFLLVVDRTVMGTVLCLDWRRTDGTITPLRANHILLIGEIPPIGHTFLTTALPLFLSEHSKLLDNLLGL
jgi:hypothetical protein